MTAQLYIFPLERRVGYIREKAAKLVNQRDKAAAERYLADSLLPCAAGSLRRLGFDWPEIEPHLKALRDAVIAESWRTIMQTPQTGAERA